MKQLSAKVEIQLTEAIIGNRAGFSQEKNSNRIVVYERPWHENYKMIQLRITNGLIYNETINTAHI